MLFRSNEDIFRFFQYMIRFRKAHRVLRRSSEDGACGFPDISIHGVTPWHNSPFEDHEKYIGVMFAGWERDTGAEVVYVASNAWWEDLEVTLPELPASMFWTLAADTWETEQHPRALSGQQITVRARSVVVLVGR